MDMCIHLVLLHLSTLSPVHLSLYVQVLCMATVAPTPQLILVSLSLPSTAVRNMIHPFPYYPQKVNRSLTPHHNANVIYPTSSHHVGIVSSRIITKG